MPFWQGPCERERNPDVGSSLLAWNEPSCRFELAGVASLQRLATAVNPPLAARENICVDASECVADEVGPALTVEEIASRHEKTSALMGGLRRRAVVLKLVSRS